MMAPVRAETLEWLKANNLGHTFMLRLYVKGTPLPEHLEPLYRRFNPTEKQLEHAKPWTNVKVDVDPEAVVIATGVDAAGRKQRIYSPTHAALASDAKFGRIRELLLEWEDIRTQIEADLNMPDLPTATREAALVAYLIYETGVRPGSENDTRAKVQAYGATTLQLRHVKRCSRGVRLRFVGKKGVQQNVLVTNPYLVRVLLQRKRDCGAWSNHLFQTSVGELRRYFKTLGSGNYSPKDFRTARGTSMALELLGNRKRLPSTKMGRKRLLNGALDRIAKTLGNTRAVCKRSYCDPGILRRYEQ